MERSNGETNESAVVIFYLKNQKNQKNQKNLTIQQSFSNENY